MGRQIRQLFARTDGQDLLEYGLLAALIAVVVLGGLKTLGTTVDTVFWQVIASSV